MPVYILDDVIQGDSPTTVFPPVSTYDSMEVWAQGGAEGGGGGGYAKASSVSVAGTAFISLGTISSGTQGVADDASSRLVAATCGGDGAGGSQGLGQTGDTLFNGGNGTTAAGGGGAGSGGDGVDGGGGGVVGGAGGTPDGGKGGDASENGGYPGGGGGFSAVGGFGRIVLTWTNPAIVSGVLSSSAHTTTTVTLAITASSGGGGTLLYTLQRAPDVAGSPGSYVGIAGPATTQSWVDTGRSPGTPYWYRVITDDTDGDTPATSNAVKVTTTSSGARALRAALWFFFGIG